MDFGIAKRVNDRKPTVTGGTMGSVYYMSPVAVAVQQQHPAAAKDFLENSERQVERLEKALNK